MSAIRSAIRFGIILVLFAFVTRPAAAATAPTIFNADKSVNAWVMDSHVLVGWEPVAGATGYRVQRSDAESGITPLPVTSPAQLRLDDAGAAGHTQVTYEVTALLPGGERRTLPAIFVGALPAREAHGRMATNSTYDPNNIISDAEFTASITLSQIRSFLQSENSFLASYVTDYDGSTIDPALVIYNAATQYQISAWAILTTMQKEQSLVTIPPSSAPSPTSHQFYCAMGTNLCSSQPGFVNEVNNGTRLFRSYLNSIAQSGQTVTGWGVGIGHSTADDCLTVTPATAATAALYTYTPYAGYPWDCTTGGNYLFWNIYYNKFNFGGSSGGGGTANELVVNGGFEQGSASWTTSGSFYASTNRSYPHTGSGYAYLSLSDGTAGNNLSGSIEQSVTIPSGTTSGTLSFWYSITTDETTASVAYDTMTASVVDPYGNTLATIRYLSNLDHTPSPSTYQQVTYSIPSSWGGQTIRIRFQASTDSSYPTVFRVDDVSLTVSGSSTVTTYTLNVQSQTPSSGASISVSPADTSQQSGGSTPFSRSYTAQTTVSLTAAASAGGNPFLAWLVDGQEYSYSSSITLSMNAAHTATAVYQAPAACTSFTVSPSSINAAASSGSQNVTVTGSPAGCQGGSWSAFSSDSWLSVAPSSGSGSGSVSVSWSANGGALRSSSVSIAGNSVPVTQQGATITSSHHVRRADFNGDGRSEILWRHTNNSFGMWEMNGRTIVNGAIFATISDSNWKVLGYGDFNGDGYEDIFFRHAVTGDTAMWLMHGETIVTSALCASVPDMNWQVMAIADFDGDGVDDILWRNMATGDVAMWQVSGTSIARSSFVYSVPDLNWQIQLAADFDGDGKAEILWRNTATNAIAMWDMQGPTFVRSTLLGTLTDPAWQIISVGDYDHDGKADLLWRHSQTSNVAVWLMDHTTIAASTLVTAMPFAWEPEGSGDFDGDGNDEILWQNRQTGEVAMWTMSGGTLLNGSVFYTLTDLNWTVQPRGGIRPALDSQ